MLFGDHDTVHREDLSRLPNPDAIPDSCELELRNAVRCPRWQIVCAIRRSSSCGDPWLSLPVFNHLPTEEPQNRSDSGAHRQSRMYPKLLRKVEVQNCIMLSA